MPRPDSALGHGRAPRLGSKGSVSEASEPRGSKVEDVSEIARRFEHHLNGLAATFYQLQTHKHEHAELLPLGTTFCMRPSKALDVAKQHAIRRLSENSPHVNHAMFQDLIVDSDEWQNGELALVNAQGSSEKAREILKRQYKAQFIRLDKAGNGHLEEEDLMAVMQTFNRGWELEDIHALLREVNRHVGKADKITSPGHLTHAGSARNLGRHHESIDLDGFIALVSDDQLSEGSLLKSGIKRDCKILREALKMENNYNLYKDDGHWNQGGNAIKGPTGRMALLADVVPGIVIVMNALVLGLSSDIAEDHLVWKAFNIFFLAFYTLEFIVKVYLFGWRWFFLGDEWAWNYFDVFCLALSWVEEVITWILTAVNNGQSVDLNTMVFIRMLRLTRLVRLVRTLRFEIFYELKMMVLGVVSGMRVLIWAMVLLLVIIYTTGVAAKNVFGQEEPEFETVPAAMFTLFRCFTDGCESYDGKPLMERMRPKYGVLLVVSYVCMFMLVCLGVFNLIMAIFLENVVANQLQRKLMGIDNTANKMEVDIKDSLLRLVLRSKTNGVPEEVEEDLRAISQTFHRWDARVRAMFETLSSSQVVITKPAFLSWLQDKEFISVLKEADIETANQAGIFECLDADMSGWLTMDEIYNGLMRLRGPVAKSEIVGFCLRLRHVAQIVHSMSD
ncbi:L type [Durusdinium trenchii]|uniref:L type n=1 Tax=Durusdinium trenchii TaxID=1381693 RepID=A0ABP0NEE5_9DINO